MDDKQSVYTMYRVHGHTLNQVVTAKKKSPQQSLPYSKTLHKTPWQLPNTQILRMPLQRALYLMTSFPHTA